MYGSERLIQAYGVREIVTGVGILASENPAPWILGRIGGDALDLATLAAGYSTENPKRDNVGIALGAVAGVTALDAVCAAMLSSSNGQRSLPHFYDRDRSGFPAPPESMRGAASDFEVPRDFRAPEALRPYTEGGRQPRHEVAALAGSELPTEP
jgi:hypothetical protein